MSKKFRFDIFLAITQEPQDMEIPIKYLDLLTDFPYDMIGMFLWKNILQFLVKQISCKNMALPVSPILIVNSFFM